MNTGKLVRLNRLFSHASGRLCSVAVDHFIGYGQGLPDGLRHIGATLAAMVAARPDAVTMHKGIAASAWAPYAGPSSVDHAEHDRPARRHGSRADCRPAGRRAAWAPTVLPWRRFPRRRPRRPICASVADCVRQAAAYEMPVICHIYPRDPKSNRLFAPEDIAWAVHCAVEAGVDVVKTPYCGDVQGLCTDRRRLSGAAGCRRRAEGGNAPAALEMVSQVVRSGARGRHHRSKHLGLLADRGRGAGLQGRDPRRGRSPAEAMQQVGLVE